MYNKTCCGHSIPQHHVNNMQSPCLWRVFSRPFKPITSSQYRFYKIHKKKTAVVFIPCKQLLLKFLNVLVYIDFHTKNNKSLRTKNLPTLFRVVFFHHRVGGFVGTCWKAETASFKLGTTPCATASFGSESGSDGWVLGCSTNSLKNGFPKKRSLGM